MHIRTLGLAGLGLASFGFGQSPQTGEKVLIGPDGRPIGEASHKQGQAHCPL